MAADRHSFDPLLTQRTFLTLQIQPEKRKAGVGHENPFGQLCTRSARTLLVTVSDLVRLYQVRIITKKGDVIHTGEVT